MPFEFLICYLFGTWSLWFEISSGNSKIQISRTKEKSKGKIQKGCRLNFLICYLFETWSL
jgi:hypothetical protein